MRPFEKYIKLKEEFGDNENVKGALPQYLHIVQVMEVEEESYKKHRDKMNEWLNSIERFIRSHAGDEK